MTPDRLKCSCNEIMGMICFVMKSSFQFVHYYLCHKLVEVMFLPPFAFLFVNRILNVVKFAKCIDYGHQKGELNLGDNLECIPNI